MNENTGQSDIEKEKKTNTKLAVAVGVIGMGAFGAFYVLFFLMMIFRPGLLFSVMPFPSISTAVVSDGGRTYMLSQKPDMSTLSVQEDRPPAMKHYLALLEGEGWGPPQEVPPFESAIGADGRLILLGEGGYRSFDGTAWTEVTAPGIGKNPRGALSPRGLYVISRFEGGPRLVHIMDGSEAALPVPNQLMRSKKNEPCAVARLAWHQGRLFLFWSADGSVAWTAWNGSSWSPAASLPPSYGYQVIADEQQLSLFYQTGDASGSGLTYFAFENNAWTGPQSLPAPAGFMDWHVFLHEGKPRLLMDQFFKQALYTIENGELGQPVQLRGAFHIADMFKQMALASVVGCLVVFLAIFGLSALINRFKLRSWSQEGARYEFASLLRRFTAYFIDSMLIMLIPALPLALFFSFDDFTRDPFSALLMMMLAVGFFFLGGYLYQSLLEGLLGQTLGKKLCGIRVLKEDFTPCGLGAAFLRNILRIVDSFFYYLVAAISLAGTLKWQRLGDLVAGTVVVRQQKTAGDRRNTD